MVVNDKTLASEEQVIYTGCNQHCGGSCVLRVHVKDGVITRIETDDGEEPQVRACMKGRAQRQRVYAPDRITHPLKRVGERGEGKFERITWDEALETVAGDIRRIRDTYGPASILFLVSAGDICAINMGLPIYRCLSMAGGCSLTWAIWSYWGAIAAEHVTFGRTHRQNTRNDILNSKLIIIWGLNPSNSVHDNNFCWYLAQAKDAGIRIVAIDPRYTDTAANFADEWIPIIPGTDTAMLIAMAYVIITENLHDQQFLDKYTVGFDKFKDYVLGIEDGIPKTPEWAEAITSVPAVTIARLAREYATTKPACLLAGTVPGRTAYGEQYHRATHTICAMTGNTGKHGGGAGDIVHTGFPLAAVYGGGLRFAPNPVEDDRPPAVHYFPPKINYILQGPRGSVNLHEVSDAILKGKAGGYPADYKMVITCNTNYLNQDANINKTVRAFKALESVVVLEQFISPTARYADIVLPTTTFLERDDFTSGSDQLYMAFQRKCIEPIGECKPHYFIAAELAKKLGIEDFDTMTYEERIEQMPKKNTLHLPLTLEMFREKGVMKIPLPEPWVRFKEEIEDPEKHPFPTPSGKIEIYSERLAELNDPLIPPIPKWIEPWENRNDPLAKKYPLQLISTHPKRRAHTQMETIPWLRELVPQEVLMNTVDAKARGIRTGDLVRVFNDRGQMIIPARVSQRIMPGVVDINEGAWYAPDEKGVDRGGNPNVLTKDKPSPLGAFTASSNALVQIEKAQEG
jgi:anaerobic dimethyl sulfoxide reductase subunit A